MVLSIVEKMFGRPVAGTPWVTFAIRSEPLALPVSWRKFGRRCGP
jgi:hypothetical protein